MCEFVLDNCEYVLSPLFPSVCILTSQKKERDVTTICKQEITVDNTFSVSMRVVRNNHLPAMKFQCLRYIRNHDEEKRFESPNRDAIIFLTVNTSNLLSHFISLLRLTKYRFCEEPFLKTENQELKSNRF